MTPVSEKQKNGGQHFVNKVIWIAVAGAFGTLSRYALGGLVQRVWGNLFPWGTLCVNGAGCFLFGLIWAYSEDRLSVSSELRIIILLGFMGAFTTFSSFMFETVELLKDSQWLAATMNVMAQNGLGLLLFFVGQTLGKMI